MQAREQKFGDKVSCMHDSQKHSNKKGKTDKLYFTQVKIFFIDKETINSAMREPTKQKTIIENYTFFKGLVSGKF